MNFSEINIEEGITYKHNKMLSYDVGEKIKEIHYAYNLDNELVEAQVKNFHFSYFSEKNTAGIFNFESWE